eukprot:jgi/Chlat1/5711/Chrsp38S05552
MRVPAYMDSGQMQLIGNLKFVVFASVSYFTVTYISSVVFASSDVSRFGEAEQAQLWPVMAFGTQLVINILTMAFDWDPGRMSLDCIVCFINLTACFNFLLAAFPGAAPVLSDVRGRRLYPQRFVAWGHSTVAMLFLCGLVSDYSANRKLATYITNVIMIVTGFTASWCEWAPWGAISLCISMLCFCHVSYAMWHMLGSSSHAPGGKRKLTTNMEYLKIYTVAAWSAFPIIWVAAALHLMTPTVEESAYTFCDFFSKVAFTSSLLRGNFLTSEQRRLNAFMDMEEGKRVQLIKELENELNKKDKFLATISHDLRTPLNGIIGLSESALEGSCGAVPDNLHKTLHTIKISGVRLMALVCDILDNASLHENALYIKQEPVMLKQLVDDAFQLTKILVAKDVQLISKVPESLPPFLGDTGRILQILFNLLGNASKFTHQGSITVSADLIQNGTAIAISVTDTGIGIPEDKINVIFEAFQQADASTGKKYGGTGLGLSLVKQLVLAHRGTVTVNSTFGQGTTFAVTLPFERPQGTAAAPTPKPFAPARSVSRKSHHGPPQLITLPESPSKESSHAPHPHSPQETNTTTTGATTTAGGTGTTTRDPTSPKEPPTSGGPALTAANNNLTKATIASIPSGPAVSSTTRDGVSTNEPLLPLTAAISTASELVAARRTHKESHGVVEILSVDDDAINQMVIESLLQPLKCKVTQAMDGIQALEYISKATSFPDLILLDVMMPKMSGYEVCEQIRKLYPSANIPIIMISAKSQEKNIVEGLKAGSNDYVTKPFNRTEMLARIQTQLKLKDAWRIEVEAARHVQLLQKMLPMPIITRLQSGQTMISDSHEDVTVLFTDIVGFTTIASSTPTMSVIHMLNEMFTAFDGLVDKHGVYKVETIGDAYMAVAGHEECSAANHAERVLNLALDMIEAVSKLILPAGMPPVQIRVGMHSGPAYAGVIGAKCPRYCFFGDTVNTARHVTRMESNGFPMAVHCSDQTYERLIYLYPDDFVLCGARKIKGKGIMRTFLHKSGLWEEALHKAQAMAALAARDTTTTTPIEKATVGLQCELITPSSIAASSSQARAKPASTEDTTQTDNPTSASTTTASPPPQPLRSPVGSPTQALSGLANGESNNQVGDGTTSSQFEQKYVQRKERSSMEYGSRSPEAQKKRSSLTVAISQQAEHRSHSHDSGSNRSSPGFRSPPSPQSMQRMFIQKGGNVPEMHLDDASSYNAHHQQQQHQHQHNNNGGSVSPPRRSHPVEMLGAHTSRSPTNAARPEADHMHPNMLARVAQMQEDLERALDSPSPRVAPRMHEDYRHMDAGSALMIPDDMRAMESAQRHMHTLPTAQQNGSGQQYPQQQQQHQHRRHLSAGQPTQQLAGSARTSVSSRSSSPGRYVLSPQKAGAAARDMQAGVQVGWVGVQPGAALVQRSFSGTPSPNHSDDGSGSPYVRQRRLSLRAQGQHYGVVQGGSPRSAANSASLSLLAPRHHDMANPHWLADLQHVLQQAGLEQHFDALAREDVSVDLLATMSDDNLRALGVTALGARVRLRQAAQQACAHLDLLGGGGGGCVGVDAYGYPTQQPGMVSPRQSHSSDGFAPRTPRGSGPSAGPSLERYSSGSDWEEPSRGPWAWQD